MADRIHEALVAAIEKPERAYLWTPAETIEFTPRVLPKVYGDGRALFALSTMNQRPAYWVIRACSTWGSAYDMRKTTGPDCGEMTDEILTSLEEEFGDGLCGYSGTSLFHDRETRMAACDCEDCASDFIATWPMVWGNGGCFWGRMQWPEGFSTTDGGYILIKDPPHA